jgi:hypothetical protein
MLPLHITFRNLISVSLSLIIIFTSCSDTSKADLAVIKELNESIENSNKSTARNTEDILTSLKEKMSDPGTAEKAQVWYPKAQMIQAISIDAYNYIEEITKEKRFEKMFENDSLGLFEKLADYRNRLLQVDPTITKEFKQSMRLFINEIDSANTNQKGKFKKYFIGVSTEGAKAMLTKLQNNIRLNEQRMIAFCNEQFAIHHIFHTYSALITQNSSIVQSGDKIEITAGVGAIFTNYNTEVFIYGKPMEIKDDGVAHYKLKAASKPGKYYVPVKINYTDQNGMKQSIQKIIEYTVAAIQQK